MDQPARGWESLSPQQREQVERELRARGIDPASIASVRLEGPAAPRDPAPTPESEGDMVDLARPGPPSSMSVQSSFSHRIEFTVNGRKQVFNSWDEVPQELRELLQSAQRAAQPAGDRAAEGPALPSGFVAGPASPRPQRLAEEDIAALEQLIRSGDKIGAIKLVRERTNLGLAEAKTIVDAMEAALGLSKKRGCAAMVLLCVGLGVMLCALL